LRRLGIILSVGTLLMLTQSHDAGAFLPRDRVTVSVEVIVNAVEGSPRSGCQASEEARAYSKKEWWVAVAEAKPHTENEEEWEGLGSGLRCGSGSFEKTHSDSEDASANPYLIAGVSTVARLIRQMEDERVLAVEISLALRELSGFEDSGKPIYQRSQMKRELFFSESRDAFVPLLVASDIEREALGIHEVFLRVAAGLAREKSAAAYGVVSVTSGMKEAELLLDGGVVGKISTGSETTLRNVPVGLRVVGVRDSSGHEIRKVVRVVANRTVPVDLSLPDPAGSVRPYRLAPLGKNAEGYEEYRRESDGAVVAKIPAGEFLMGNKETERTPLEHRVYVSDFLMDKTGVTWDQFKKFADATGIPLPLHEPYWGIHDDHPVVYVTWEEANAYCEWAGGRLPTEAEREKAARGTDDRKYPWGNEEPEPERAVYRRTWGNEATGAVGTHPAGSSPYGLQDMGGNVWEWCSDWYDDGYYAVSPYRDPKGPPSGRAHVVRGGSWDSRPTVLSCSCRSWGHRGYRDGDFGFRCAMNAPR
jgi:formylglycine-generating enzyme required for sulfatase activity